MNTEEETNISQSTTTKQSMKTVFKTLTFQIIQNQNRQDNRNSLNTTFQSVTFKDSI